MFLLFITVEQQSTTFKYIFPVLEAFISKPYSVLKSANVDGTKELLRISCKGIPKVFNHMSSISVFSSISLQVSERDSIDGQSTPYTAEGYSKSKWVAEKLVDIARSRGLTANIFRLGMVSWHTETGHYNELDWFNRLVSGVITLGK